ncbi:MAG: hypothetical protein ACR2O3_14050 [Rhizobiaceae bacterium]
MTMPNTIDSERGFFPTRLAATTVILIAAVLIVLLTSRTAANTEGGEPKLTTNQSMIENQMSGKRLQIKNVQDAFQFVFSKLPERVFVYPTENYYYFTFPADGVVYAGNLRLAAQDRDKGIIHFAAFRQANQTSKAGEMMYRPMTAEDGVKVDKLSSFLYRVTYRSKSVEFELNDVSAVKPPDKIITSGEKYLGLAADESGIRFFLFYNEKHKLFAYVLDETVDVLDQFVEIENTTGSMLVGERTGFVLYNHHYLDRRVLIGVHGANTIVNNYFDGPADQLPENHIMEDNLRKAIEDSDPGVKGMLDTFGYFKNGLGRYLISPYAQYLSLDELAGYDQCASNENLPPEIYDACFHAGEE